MTKKTVPVPDFATIKFKNKTAARYREFSRSIARSHTEAMELILDFFENYRLSPSDDLGPNMKTLEGNLKKRINAVVAILRDIEKTQTKPTLAMMQLLFQEASPTKKEIKEERKKFSNSESQTVPKLSILQNKNQIRKSEINPNLIEIQNLFNSVVVSRSSFGKPYLRLQMGQKEFESLKSKFL